MENEEVVNQPAEPTAPATDTAETQPVETPIEPADALIEPEKKVSESVPYERFHEVNSEKNKLREEVEYLKSQISTPPVTEPMANVPQLDPDSEAAVRATARAEWDEMERQKFVTKHEAELTNDPILAGTIRELIARENRSGRLADREVVYQQAKKMLDEKVKPVAQQAQTEGFKEGQEKAVQKAQTGAVGNTNYKEPTLDDSQLSSAELAKKYNLPVI